jgi:hypothetical protein
VSGFREGDAVGVAWLHDACGGCEYCRTGWDSLCLAQRNSGYNVNGSFAEYVMGAAPYVARLPANPDFAALARRRCTAPRQAPLRRGFVSPDEPGSVLEGFRQRAGAACRLNRARKFSSEIRLSHWAAK